MTAALFLIVLLALIALGMPIAFALLFSGVAIMLQMGQFDSQVVVQNAIGGADNFVLMAVPFFILAGEFMNAGGLSKRIVEMAGAFVGHLRGLFEPRPCLGVNAHASTGGCLSWRLLLRADGAQRHVHAIDVCAILILLDLRQTRIRFEQRLRLTLVAFVSRHPADVHIF